MNMVFKVCLGIIETYQVAKKGFLGQKVKVIAKQTD